MLAGLSGGHRAASLGGYWEPLLLAAIALGTGYKQMPFSATWWLVLLAAFALETELLLGTATVLSLTVLLGWYGVRLRHPQAVSALWGGTRGSRKCKEEDPRPSTTSGKWDFQDDRWVRGLWQAWDLVVHGLPAALVIFWHGPGVSRTGTLIPGTVTPLALLVSLPLNVLWLWGLGLGLGGGGDGGPLRRLWPLGMRLEDTNMAYCVAPALPQGAWLWIYGSHWMACVLWAAVLLLPAEVTFAFCVFAGCGIVRTPYTTGWWTLFLSALLFGESRPLLKGIACCCGATTCVGFYGAQLLAPYAFEQLVRSWAVKPALRYGPRWLAARLPAMVDTELFWAAARLGDVFIHLVPTMTAVYVFRHSVTAAAVLASLPTNLIWLACSGQSTLAGTNAIYGIEPDLPPYVWRFIYGSHWIFCTMALAGLALAA